MSATSVGLSFVLGAAVGSSFKSGMVETKNTLTSLADKIKSLNTIKSDLSNLKKLADAGKTGTEAFTKLSQKLKDNKIDISNIDTATTKVNDEINKLYKKRGLHLDLKSNIKNVTEQFKNFGSYIAKIGITTLVITTPVMDFEKAKGEIASLGIGESGIEKISKTAIDFTNQFAGTTAPEFIRASYDIKSGISSLSDEGVAEFTKLSALTAKATKASVADMTKLFAMGHGIFREQFANDDDFGSQFSNAVASAVQAFRTDGPDLIQGISNLGATATKMGVSLEEQLAVIGVSKGAFNSAADAATSYRAVLAGIGKAKENGLVVTDSGGNMLKMADILVNIKKEYGKLSKIDLSEKIRELFGSQEASKTIMALIDKTEDLSKAEIQLQKDMKEGIKTTQMAKQLSRGEELDLLKNQLHNLSIEFGSALLPYMKVFVGFLSEKVKLISKFVTENPKAVNQFVKLAGVIAGAVAAYKLIAMFIGIATTAQTLFNLAALANPIGLIVAGVVAGVVALTIAGIALYKNWDYIVNKLSIAWANMGVGINKLKKALGMDYDENNLLYNSEKADKSTAERLTASRQRMLGKFNQTANVTFNPQITIQGNADKAVLEQALDSKKIDFEKMWANMQNNNNRLGYAQ